MLKKNLPEHSLKPVVESANALATKARLMDAAELLFMELGFEAAGLRLITQKAEANLASVSYHFGSKEDFFAAVLGRRLDLLNAERVEMLDRLSAEAGGKPLPVEQILDAMFLPALRLGRDVARGGSDFLRFLGRAYTDPAPFVRALLSERYSVMIKRFKAAFAATLPHLSKEELSMRLHFTMGALALALAGTDTHKLIDKLATHHPNQHERVLARLAPFLKAGLMAPEVALDA